MNGYVHTHYMYQCLYLPLVRIPKPKTIGLNELEMYFSFTLKNQEVDSMIWRGASVLEIVPGTVFLCFLP